MKLSNNRATTSKQTFLLTTTVSSTNNSSNAQFGARLHTALNCLSQFGKKHCYRWQTRSFTITARTAVCGDRDCLPTASPSPNFRKHWSTRPFLRALSGLAFIKKLTWNPVSQSMSSVSLQPKNTCSHCARNTSDRRCHFLVNRFPLHTHICNMW